MGRPDEAAKLLLIGHSPSRIAELMGVTISTVMGYLFRQAGEGRIQRSDIVLSIDRETRLLVETAIKEKRSTTPWKIKKWIKKNGKVLNQDDVQVYLNLRSARVEFGDLYESLREIETCLHTLVKETLSGEYGADWWRHVPEEVRIECATLQERDETPADEKYCYTTFIHIKKILEKNWQALSKRLPTGFTRDKKQFLSQLGRLNYIRNAVMHPVKGIRLDDEAFAMVRSFQREITKIAEPQQVSWNQLHADISAEKTSAIE